MVGCGVVVVVGCGVVVVVDGWSGWVVRCGVVVVVDGWSGCRLLKRRIYFFPNHRKRARPIVCCVVSPQDDSNIARTNPYR